MLLTPAYISGLTPSACATVEFACHPFSVVEVCAYKKKKWAEKEGDVCRKSLAMVKYCTRDARGRRDPSEEPPFHLYRPNCGAEEHTARAKGPEKWHIISLLVFFFLLPAHSRKPTITVSGAKQLTFLRCDGCRCGCNPTRDTENT